jgi:hypothetical protein
VVGIFDQHPAMRVLDASADESAVIGRTLLGSLQ